MKVISVLVDGTSEELTEIEGLLGVISPKSNDLCKIVLANYFYK